MRSPQPIPPRFFLHFFRWFCHPKLADHIEGDLLEVYGERLSRIGKRKADIKFVIDVFLLFRPGIIRPREGYQQLNTYGMYKSYFKIGWRNLVRNKGYSFINIGGLAMGMTVAIMIGLWLYDELSFNKFHKNYQEIAQFWGGGINPETKEIEGMVFVEYPIGEVLRNNYPQYFKYVSKSFRTGDCTVSSDDKHFRRRGLFVEEDFLTMLSLKMEKGSYQSLNDPNAVIISSSAAKAFFGDEEPLNQTLRLENLLDVTVTGVYEDIPHNSSFSEFQLFFPWPLLLSYRPWIKEFETNWSRQFVNIYIQLQPGTTMEAANAAIHNLYAKNIPQDYYVAIEKNQPFAQLIPMNTWHLYSEFENGKPAGGRITYVWLFGIVGGLVLLVACINFINLSTARSEKRAREVGVRKTMGSYQRQLVIQFLSESLMTVLLAFGSAMVLMTLLLNPFNVLADKAIVLPFNNPMFWGIALVYILLIVLMAGLYPAFYLSSFQPVKVLKGVVHTGRLAALPRKVLVVVQFTVSVVLIMGTLIIHKQLQYARNRPVGYDLESLISFRMSDPGYIGKVDVIRTELLKTGVVSEVATSSSHLTGINAFGGAFEWQGKDPNRNLQVVFSNVSPDFGNTLGWEVVSGRDFSRDLATDTKDAIIINEAAVKQMGLDNPIGNELTNVNEFGHPIWTKTIIGVVQDIIVESPYDPVKPTIYYFNEKASNMLHIRIKPEVSPNIALPKIEETLGKIVPTALFDYMFVDEEYGQKFSQEKRLGELSGIFAALAIFISCLGLFGLTSFVVEQRKKEIGVRKVFGATVSNLWQMLSSDFIVLVIYSYFIAIPVGYYLMYNWLQKYEYRTEISWWLILVTCLSAILITLLTVSYQSIKAALMNPVRSLRSE